MRVCAPARLSFCETNDAAELLLATLRTFRRIHGWGRAIAAPQIGIPLRIIATHSDDVHPVLVNPEILWRSAETVELWDDCMSLPEIALRVRRHRSITVTYHDLDGQPHAIERASVSLSELLQHEIDHLDGTLMTARQVPQSPIVARENRSLWDRGLP